MAYHKKDLKANMFWLYQIFDLYSFGCLCYLFYFSKESKTIPWKNLKSTSEIFYNFYNKDIKDKEFLFESESDYIKFFEKTLVKDRADNINSKFFNNTQPSEDKNSYDSQLIVIIKKCLNPFFEKSYKNPNEYLFKYTMKNALDDLTLIDCVKKFKKNKEFDYDFQEGIVIN